ncbi:envelope glycoprotein [Lonchura striata]|uniref:Envelope glycoprotein n=1 Tax=Lonchura striata TaxID=40157 RepID=A0A218UET0_9PASE|nr:envelope glycoprotein [Lonchura striata domestica]
MTNAMSETRKILRAFPQDPEPTITQMVEACTKATSTEATVTMAAILQEPTTAGRKQAMESKEGPREDTKWPFAAPEPPYHPGGPVAQWSILEDWQSHEDRLHLFQRTANLDPDNRWVFTSAIPITFPDEDLVRVPAGLLQPPYCDHDTTVLILGDSRHTPNELTSIPEVVCFQPGSEVVVSIMYHEPPFTLDMGFSFALLYLLDIKDYIGQDAEEDKYVFLTQTVCCQRPIIKTILSLQGRSISINLMADTGVDVAIIPRSKWPCDWELVPPCGTISGVGGALNSLHSKHLPLEYTFFIIKKPGKDKWCLLQDLRRVNNVIKDMGPLQPGLPSPSMPPCSLLGLTMENLAPLFNLLQGDCDLASPRELTPAAKGALERVADAIRSHQAHRVDRSLPITLAILVITDGSGKSQKSVITWKDLDSQKWESDIQLVEGFPQIAELAAIMRAFKKFQQPFNLVTDSAMMMAAQMTSDRLLQQKALHCIQLLAATITILLWLQAADGWIMPQPKENVWGKTKRVAASIFLQWYAAAKALGELSHLECWIIKHANASSTTLSNLLEDKQTTRHDTLQKRAAIDFLLLTHGHSCEDFEGLCCFNLSSRSTSIQANIQQTQT